MPKPYEVKLRVEEIALGSVLRKLHELPGVIDVDLDLGHGGAGHGADKLAAAAAAQGGTQAERAIRALSNGPLSRKEIAQQVGAKASSVYSVLNKLKADGVIVAVSKGVYALKVAPKANGGAPVLALPSPVPRAHSGRIAQGSGATALLLVLKSAPRMVRRDLSHRLNEAGVPKKSIAGVVNRADRDKLIKRQGSGLKSIVELTAKGRTAAEAVHHG